MLARREIGLLRDARYVFPVLESPVFEERLIGIAGLAFLWSVKGNELIRGVAMNDRASGLRRSALWAYGFAGGEGAEELLLRQSENDSDPTVRTFCR